MKVFLIEKEKLILVAIIKDSNQKNPCPEEIHKEKGQGHFLL